MAHGRQCRLYALHRKEALAAVLIYAALALIAVNLVTILRFHQDKQRAVAGVRRIPERELLSLAFLGGTPGAFLARRWFRHKTRKQPFSALLVLIAVVQAVAIIVLLSPR